MSSMEEGSLRTKWCPSGGGDNRWGSSLQTTTNTGSSTTHSLFLRILSSRLSRLSSQSYHPYVIFGLVTLFLFSCTLYGSSPLSATISSPPSPSFFRVRSQLDSDYSTAWEEKDQAPVQIISLHGARSVSHSSTGSDEMLTNSRILGYRMGSIEENLLQDTSDPETRTHSHENNNNIYNYNNNDARRYNINRNGKNSKISGTIDLSGVTYTISPPPELVCGNYKKTLQLKANAAQPQSSPQQQLAQLPLLLSHQNDDDHSDYDDKSRMELTQRTSGGENKDERGESRGNNDKRDEDLFLLGFIHSSPTNFARRKVIRETWASPRHVSGHKVKFLFIVGHYGNDSIPAYPISQSSQIHFYNNYNEENNNDPKKIQEQILLEAQTHGDIVQVNMTDSYENLTYKHLAAYKWILDRCNTSHYVVKVDDDAFLDTFQAVSFLADTFDPLNEFERPHGVLACSIFPAGTPTKRIGKWSLTKKEYPFHSYPSYCSGVAYFITPDVIHRLLAAAEKVQSIFIDDLYITGLLAARLSPSPVKFPLNLRFAYSMKQVKRWLKESDHDVRSTAKSSPFLVADIGADHSHWQSLASDLWKRTAKLAAWRQSITGSANR